jgi:hypothetical protein
LLKVNSIALKTLGPGTVALLLHKTREIAAKLISLPFILFNVILFTIAWAPSAFRSKADLNGQTRKRFDTVVTLLEARLRNELTVLLRAPTKFFG